MRVRMSRNRFVLGIGILGLAVITIFWGRSGSLSEATANPPVPAHAAAQPDSPTATAPSSDYSHRVVAYIYDTIPITREELGEYLIARMGKERLGILVNKRIIEHVCQQKGIEVTPAEVEADLAETLKGLAVNRADFVNKVLKSYNKAMTLYEWKEDVVKPRLLLTKLCRDRVQISEEDLKNSFEAYHGEKLDCRIILWPSQEERHVFMMYPKLRDSEEEFDRVSKQQADGKLAATGGKIAPFGRHTTGNEDIEKAAFALKPGEISQVIATPQGLVVIKCIQHLPPDGKKLEEVRDELTKDIIYRKINQQEIPKLFSELRTQAHPTQFLKEGETEEELLRAAQQELQEVAPKTPAATAPAGN